MDDPVIVLTGMGLGFWAMAGLILGLKGDWDAAMAFGTMGVAPLLLAFGFWVSRKKEPNV